MVAGRRAASAVVAASLIGALLGCSATAPADASLPEGVAVTLVQLRGDVAARQAQVQIRNGSEEPLRIGAVRLHDPRFDGAAERVVARKSAVPAGGAVDVRVQLPAMDCTAPDDGDSTVTLELDASEVTTPIPDPLGFLPALHARECLAVRLAEVATIGIASFTPAPAGEVGSLTLAITPTGAGSARLGEVDSTPLLMYAPGAPAAPFALGVDIGPRSPATTVEIPLVPQRCDPHVVQEDKRGTIFTIDVVVGETSGEIDLAAPPDMKARMLTWVADWCGFGAQ